MAAPIPTSTGATASDSDGGPDTDDATALDAFARAYGEPSPELAMVKACADLRQRAGELDPPIGLRRMVGLCGAEKVERAISTAGRLEVDSNGFRIIVQRSSSWRRKRFTVAHEIGHILLLQALRGNQSDLQALQARTSWSRVERLCNLAAAEILIPMTDLVQSVERMLMSGESVQVLYDRYLTSYAPLFLRFVDGGAVAIVLWRNYARHSNEISTLRAVQSYRASDAPWIPYGMTATKHVFPDLVTAAVASKTVVSGDIELTIGRRSNPMWAICLPFASKDSNAPRQIPLFDGFDVPDERSQPWDAVLLVFSKTDANEPGPLWEVLSRSHYPNLRTPGS